MAKYTYDFEGVSYSTDRKLSAMEQKELIQSYKDAGLLNPEVQMQQEMKWKDVSQNQSILNAYKTYYEEHNNEQWEGTNEELTDSYFEQMRWFENNTGSMLKLVGRLKGAGDMSERERMSLAVMWKAWDNIVPFYEDDNKKWTAFIDHVGANVLDASNLSGLFSFGTGTAAAITAKQIAKAGLRETLFAGMKKGGTSGALNAGAIGTALATGNQEIDYELEGLERNWADVALEGGAATVMGTGVGSFLGTTGAGVNFAKATKALTEEAAEKAVTTTAKNITDTAKAAEQWRDVLADETITGELRQAAQKAFIANLGDTTTDKLNRSHSGVGNRISNEQAYENGIKLLTDLGITKHDSLTPQVLVDNLYKRYTNGEVALKDSTAFKALTFKLEHEMYDTFLKNWNTKGADPWESFSQFEKVLMLSQDLASASGRDLQLTSLRQRMGPTKYGMVVKMFGDAAKDGKPKTLGDVKMLLKEAEDNPGWGAKTVDALNEFWIHNILGSPITLGINTISSSAHMLERNMIDIGAGLKRGDIKESRRAMTALGRELTAIPSAFIYALRAADRSRGYLDPQRVYAGEADEMAPVIGNRNYTLSNLVKPKQVLNELKRGDESFVTAAGNLVGNVNRLVGGRGMLATDEFVKQMAFRGELRSRLTMEALELVGKDGRFGTAAEAHAWSKREFNKLIKLHIDSIGKGQKPEDPRLIAALNAAREATFQNDFRRDPLGFVGKGVAKFSGKHPLFKQIQPFVRTPTNLASWGLERTPGLQMLSKDFMEMLQSPDPQVRARAEMTMNLGVMYWTAALTTAMAGELQGPGDPNYNSRKFDEAAGEFLPYSIKLEDGTRVQIRRTDPMAKFFMTIGAMQDALSYSNEAGLDLFASAALSTAKALIDVPSLTGIADVFETAGDISDSKDPVEGVQKYLGNRFKTLLPYYRMHRDILQPSQADRAMFTNIGYNPEDIWNTALFADDPADPYDKQRDPLGRPMFMRENAGFAWSGLAKEDKPSDAVLMEMSRLNSGRFAPQVTRNGVNLQEIKVKPGGRQSVYDLWRQTAGTMRIKGIQGFPKNKKGATLEEALARIIKSPEYKDILGDAGRLEMLEGMIAQYETISFSQVMPELLGREHEVFKKTSFKAFQGMLDQSQVMDEKLTEDQDYWLRTLQIQ